MTRITEDRSSGPATSSWLSFAGLLLFVVGFFNLLDGIVALSKEEFYVISEGRLLVFNFAAWGAIWIILGIVMMVVGGAILARQAWARTPGIALAILAIIGQLVYLNAFPVWSVIVIALCVIAIYGLMVPPSGSIAT